MRKTLVTLLWCMICVNCLAGLALADSDWGYSFISGDWVCYVNEGGTTIYIGYEGNSTYITVPNSINGKIVTGVRNDNENANDCRYYAEPGSYAAKALSRSYGFTVSGYDNVRLRYRFEPNDAEGNISWVTNGLEVFACNQYITSAVIPDFLGIDAVAEDGFAGCNNLTSITIPEGIDTLKRGSLRCENLTVVHLPDSLKSIEKWVFSGATSLTDVYLPDNLTYFDAESGIRSEAHLYTSLNSQTARLLSQNSTTWFNFEGYPDVNLHYDYGNEQIVGLSAYRSNSDIEQLVIPEGVTSIKRSGFDGLQNLSSVQLPSTLKTLESYAFANCPKLTYMELPQGFETIKYLAFQNTDITVVVPDSVTDLQLYEEDFKGKVIIPCTVVDLLSYGVKYELIHQGEEIFLPGKAATHTTAGHTDGIRCGACNQAIKEQEEIPAYDSAVTISMLPGDLTVIEAEAFAGIAADVVIVPAGCTAIGARAFANCPQLLHVYLPATATVAADAFSGSANVMVILTE